MKKSWLLLSLLLLSGAAGAGTAPQFIANINYVDVTPAHSTDVKPGQIEVIEFYWYGCPHCFALEPYVEAWEKKLPKDVVFKRIPGALPNSEFYFDGQAAFTADALGIGEKIREPLFNAIHLDNKIELTSDLDAMKAFFAQYGVSAQQFDSTWNSFGVQTRLSQAGALENSYGVNGVPTIIVDGKWRTGAGYQMEPANIMNCVDYLIQKARDARKQKRK